MTSDGDSDGAVRDGKTLTSEEAVEFAVLLHKSGELEVAEKIYGRILKIVPDEPNALHYLGILNHQTGRSEAAVDLIRRAIASHSEEPGMHNNLGNVLLEQQRPGQAAEAYQCAIALKPDYVEAHSNLGVALRRLDRLDDAEASYRAAFAIDPSYREAYDNLGRLLTSRGRPREAISFHMKAMELEPHNADTRRLLTATYAASGEHEKALEVVRQWLLDEPHSPTALHLRSAISGRDVPARAGDRYVESMFDRFASSFDKNLEKLGYRAPELVGAAFGKVAGDARAELDILDAGCGTGLCGPLLAPYARHLLGVDLSPKMLERAFERRLYDGLIHRELTEFLRDNPGKFDAVVSADTLCYFGSLHQVLGAAAQALREGGVLVFTVEEETGPEPFRIHPHGRYAHRRDHIEEALAASGLAEIAIDADVLRQELGEPVSGLVVSAKRSGHPEMAVGAIASTIVDS